MGSEMCIRDSDWRAHKKWDGSSGPAFRSHHAIRVVTERAIPDSWPDLDGEVAQSAGRAPSICKIAFA